MSDTACERRCHNPFPVVVIPVVGTGEDVLPAVVLPPGALEAVFREHYPRLTGVLTRLTGDRSRAEEIAADVFWKLARRPALFRPEHNLAGWLYRAAVNLALDAHRLESRRRLHEREAGIENARTAEAADALHDVMRQEQQHCVRSVLAALKPAQAKLLLLRHSGFSYQELAVLLKCNPRSVGTLLARAESAFEKVYRARYGEER